MMMGYIIDHFLYGSLPQQPQIRDRNKSLNQLESELMNMLDGVEKRKFLDFVNAFDFFMSDVTHDSFVKGFKIGARLTYETFVDEKEENDEY